LENTTRRFDMATIGAYTKDTIVSKAGTRYVDGGGYSYAAHAARLAGIEVAAVTRLAPEDRGSTDLLREAGVAVVMHECRSSTLMRLEYPGDNVDERILTVAGLADPFEPGHLRGIDAGAWLISASVRGEVPLEVVRALKATGVLIGADVQGFVRVVGPGGELRYEAWPEQEDVLGLVDILKTDAVEAEFLTGHADIHAAAAALAMQGPREIVLTHKDGVLVRAGTDEFEAPFLPEPLRGRSGRGDTCIGSYMSRRLTAPPSEATRWAAAVTSLKMEAEGPIRRPMADVYAKVARQYAAP
jgi:sugar/nucleoside kinase (ribokinase family)